MRNALTFLAVLAVSMHAWTAEPADSAIRAAMDDLARFEQQLGSTPSKSTVNRTLKLLTLTRQRLDSSSNKDDPSWAEADQRFHQLTEALTAYLNPGASPAKTAAPAAEAPTPTPAAPAPVRQLISQDIARLSKLDRDIQSVISTLDQGGAKPFQDPEYLAKYQGSAERFANTLSRYADFPDVPEVQTVTASYQQLRTLLQIGEQIGEKARAELGDVQRELASMRQAMASERLSQLPPDADANTVSAWVARADAIEKATHARIDRLTILRDKAWLPLTRGTPEQGAAYDFQNVDSMLANSRQTLRDIEIQQLQIGNNADGRLSHLADTASFYEGLDPNDHSDRANMFLGAGDLEKNVEQINGAIQIAEAAMAVHAASASDNLTRSTAVRDRLLQARADYITKRGQALSLSRMPEPATTDSGLLDIARQTLSLPKYDVAQYRALVINTDVSHHRKKSSEIEFDDVDVSLGGEITLSGTETTTIYEWDEFQVTTAEPVGAEYFLFYNKLKRFTSGATTTPLNRWILSERFQGPQILESNL